MLEFSLALTLCFIVLFEVTYLCFEEYRKRSYPAGRKGVILPPGSLGLPIVGETLDFARKKVNFFREKHLRYGRIFKTHLFGKPLIRVYGAENVSRIILGENTIVQSSYPRSIKALMGPNGLIQSQGHTHKTRKAILMKFLSKEFLENHIPAFRQAIIRRIKLWCERSCVDIYKESRLLFVELSVRFLIDINVTEEHILGIKNELDIITENLFVLPIYFPGFGYYKAFEAKRRLKALLYQILQNMGKSSKSQQSVLEAYGTCIERDANLKVNNELLDSIFELLFTGSESISTAGFTLMYMLAKYPNIMKNIRESLTTQQELPESPSFAKTEMTYIDAVVKETLRILPPVGGAFRTILQDFELEGYTLPKGWSVAFSIRETHHNDTHIQNPMTFDPKRWLTSDEHVHYSYIPFGGGKRICPGQAYSKTLLKIMVTQLARCCHIDIVQDGELDLWPSPRPKSTILAHFSLTRMLNQRI
ncbi:hypothetical protein CHS0354_041278 [Potamilus streckersoni]|uniref:Cytochrome P450 n=1 Tax=Potamilus streckersoni TaxID=2493646 RepID=A0AAE0SE74_9BIVA|nr:hypothetical protein CHS0354_041278 [Potamilus streckersoni]